MADFITGGPVPINHPSYIKRSTQWNRPIEDELIQILQSGQDVTIVGPRQIGKSSMVGWLSTVLGDRGFATAYIDMTRLMNQNLTEEEWIRAFCTRLVDSLSAELHRDFDEDPPTLALGLTTYFGRLMRFLQRNSLLICIDEANSVPPDMLSPFYSNIRAIINERRIDDETSVDNVQFVFSGVFDPNQLIRDKNSSPFNTTHLEILRDFNKQECQQLVELAEHNGDERVSVDVVDAVYYWTQGNPFITQLFASAIDDTLGNEGTVLDANLINRMMPTIEDSAASNLDYIRDETVAYLGDSQSRREFITGVLQGKKRPFRRSTQVTRLSLIGTIRRSPDNFVEIRNPMVASILGDELLDDNVLDQPVGFSWSPSLRNEFHRILLQAFNKERLEQMLYFELGKSLANISSEGDFSWVSYKVIERAEIEEWIVDLVLASQRTNPTNMPLQTFVKQNGLA